MKAQPFCLTDNRSEVLVERRDSNGWRLVSVQHVQLAPTDVFRFFTNVHNLERITPSFLNFKILRVSSVQLAVGTTIDYTLRLHRIPVFWRTLITEWAPPHRFVDTQRIGPFKNWRHLHEFVPTENGTEIHDLVTFDLYCRSLVRTPILGWVNNDLRHIFKFRQNQIAAHLTDRTIKQLTDRRENSMLR